MILHRFIPFTSSRSPPHLRLRPSRSVLLVVALLLCLLLPSSLALPPTRSRVNASAQQPSPADASQPAGDSQAAADDPQSDLQPSKSIARSASPAPAPADAAAASAPVLFDPRVHGPPPSASGSPALAAVPSGSPSPAPVIPAPAVRPPPPAASRVPASQPTVTSRKSVTTVHSAWRPSQQASASPPAQSPPPAATPPPVPTNDAASEAAAPPVPASLSPPAPSAVPESSPVPESSAAEACLSEADVSQQKAELKTRLLSIMDAYLAVWKLEEKGEEETAALYDSKKQELKQMLRVRKDALLARACATSSSARRLLKLEDDDWFDQEDEEAAVLFTPAQSAHQDELQLSSVAEDDETDRGVMAGIIAGGSHRSHGSVELPADDDAQLFDASIHPFHAPAPSAFTELTHRDIASRHSRAAAASSPQSRAGDADEFGFVASISPARFTSTPVGQRSQRDLDEDYEEERRKRREKLKAMRVQQQPQQPQQPPASSAAEDDDMGGGQFVASISPMAPQRSSPVFEEEAEQRLLYVASISPPARRSQPVLRRGALGDSDDEWSDSPTDSRGGSRQRLEAIAVRSRVKQTL